MSLLPSLFRRGERIRPLGAALVQPLIAPAAPVPTHDWTHATAGDGAPRRVRLYLTAEAESEAAEFSSYFEDAGCSCFISPPCSHCTHPGNPLNLAEDDSAWVYGFEAEGGGA